VTTPIGHFDAVRRLCRQPARAERLRHGYVLLETEIQRLNAILRETVAQGPRGGGERKAPMWGCRKSRRRLDLLCFALLASLFTN